MSKEIELFIAAARTATESLANTTKQELEKLFSEQQTAIKLQSNLALVMERYHLEHSMISQLANWYGSKTWIERGGLFLCAAALSALLGAIIGAIAAYITICSALFVLTSYILDDHYTITAHRDGAFAEEITSLENQLKTSTCAMNDYAVSLKALCEQLGAHNLATIQMLQDIHNEHLQLEQYTKEFKESIASLEQLRVQILQENANSMTKRTHTNTQLDVILQQLLPMVSQLQSCVSIIHNIQKSYSSTKKPDASISAENDTSELILRHQQCLESARILIKKGWINKSSPLLSGIQHLQDTRDIESGNTVTHGLI